MCIMIKKTTISLLLWLLPVLLSAQAGSGVVITDRQLGGALRDSIVSTPYPYKLPIFGAKAASKGIMLPYPAGVMYNLYTGRQDVHVSDLTVGITDASGGVVVDDISLDQVVEFDRVYASVSNYNIRADLWLLPFLDVYGIFGQAAVKTNVSIGSILGKPVDIGTTANFNGYVYGVGAMLMGGYRSYFLSIDVNSVWTHFDELQNNNNAVNLSPRLGYIFHFKKHERNMVVWIGAGRAFLNNTTKGSIKLSDIAPDMGENYENTDWYQAMTPAQQKLTDVVVENFTDKHQGDVINYSLQKRPTHNWTMIVGTQYQPNRRWQFRAETNFLGGRRSALLSANYRFGF